MISRGTNRTETPSENLEAKAIRDQKLMEDMDKYLSKEDIEDIMMKLRLKGMA